MVHVKFISSLPNKGDDSWEVHLDDLTLLSVSYFTFMLADHCLTSFDHFLVPLSTPFISWVWLPDDCMHTVPHDVYLSAMGKVKKQSLR